MDENELAEKYGIDLKLLKEDQIKISKDIVLKDSQDFSLATRFGAIASVLVRNQIVSVALICDEEFNIIEQQYFLDKIRFPYLYEFRSYREMSAMVEAFNKLSEKPDVVLISGHGLTHPRLGLASHFSIFTGVPAIGIAEGLFESDKLDGEDIVRKTKKIGKVLYSKENSKPLFISPGSMISIKSAYEVCKKLVKEPHKLPEPLHLAQKYAREVKDELKLI
jgi:deoxyribonuclease V